MRTFINRSTKINSFGICQARDVVTVRDERHVPAAQHLGLASRLCSGLQLLLTAAKRTVAQALAPAAMPLAMSAMIPAYAGWRLCPCLASLPAESMRPAISGAVIG